MIPGTYLQSLQGHRTFIPTPLPPVLDLTSQTQAIIERATHLLGQVEMCRTLLPNAELLVYGSLRREALASSTIEGTIASPDELIRYQAADIVERAEVHEVANYTTALTWGVQQLDNYPISTRLIMGLHERLLHGVRGMNQAGRFKERQNYIGSQPFTSIDSAVFVPPPPDSIRNLISDLERYINNENREARVVQCPLAHYQFETIHPFHDGNGRVGRLLIILQLIQLRLLSAPLIYPSVYFERRRSDYYDRLQSVRDTGDWEGWITFFVNGLIEQCEETIHLTQTIIRLREQLRQQIGDVRRRASLNEVLDAFFHEPVRSIRAITTHTGMAANTVQPALDELHRLGMVHEITGRQKGRVYACIPLFRAIFGYTQPEPQ